MNTTPTLELVLRVSSKTDLVEHADTVDVRSRLDEREVERVAVERRHDGRLDVSDVLKPSTDQSGLKKRRRKTRTRNGSAAYLESQTHDLRASKLREKERQTYLIWLIKDYKRSLVLRLRRILKVLDILADDLPIRDEITLPVDHVRYHHDLIDLLYGELERGFGGLDVEGHDDGFGSFDSGRDVGNGDVALEGEDGVPESDPDV
jgi:hypothetical protein